MAIESVESWLSQLGLSQYVQAFAANDIDADLLPDLGDQALKDIGVASVGHRIKLLKALADLRPPANGNAETYPAARIVPSVSNLEGERRQLTVLFCDMVGFTEMASRLDPEVLQGIIRRYEDACSACVTRYDGYVFQRLGDGIVAFFGYPLAHEGEAERAIHAGLAIVDALSRPDVTAIGAISVRIGIATGLVVISDARGGAVGETMNLASRLQGVAPINTVVVSERVRRLARGAFQYEDLGQQSLKGIAKATHAYRIVAANQTHNRFEAATQGGLIPMVGRDQELGLLLKRWAIAQDGEGQVVLISGEPGIGKSRVLSVLRDRVEAMGGQALNFQSSPYHVTSAYYPMISNFERVLKFTRDDSADIRLDKLETLMVQGQGLQRSDVRFVADMLSLPSDARYGSIPITPQKHKDETLRVLLAFVQAVVHSQPTVLLYEDAHWADPTTLEVLERLVDLARNWPLLIVLTHRPEFEPKWMGYGHVTALSMSRLTRVQSSAIIAGITGGRALPADLLEEILAKTDGVPLYVEELTKAVLESGDVKEAGDRYEYAGTERTVSVPATLRDSLMARLDRSVPVREVAKVGSVIGREFSYELIAAVVPGSRTELDGALDQLTESGLAFQRGTRPAATYVFKHALVQEVAYDSLLKAHRQEMHARIAYVLEEQFPGVKDSSPELLARHLTVAGETGPAIGYWHEAGKLALKRMALNEAISHLDQGMKIIGTLPRSSERDGRELDLRNLLGTAWVGLRGFASSDAWSNFHRALRLAKTLARNEALLPIYFGMTASLVLQGRLAEGLDWVNEMLMSGQANGDADLLIMGHRSACTTYFWLGDFVQSREHGLKVLELYDEHAHRHLAESTNVDPRTIVELYISIDAWILGYPEQALQLSKAKDAHARQRGHAFDMGYALTFGSHLLELRREPETVLVRAQEAERLGQAQSLPFISDVLAQILKGIAWLRTGKVEEGIPLLRTALAKWEAGGAMMWLPYLRAVLAEGLALGGDLQGGLKLIEESLAQVARPGWEERAHLAEVLRLKAWMLQQDGKEGAAEENYLAALEVARSQQARSWELRAAAGLARLWLRQGRRSEAHALLAPVYAWFKEGLADKDLVEAKALLDQLPGQQ